MKKHSYIFIVFIALYFIFYASPILAQTNGLNTAYDYNIVDPEAQDGDILMYTDKGLMRANSASLNAMFGVMQDNPTIVIQLNDGDKSPVVTSGIDEVNVTNTNGPIKKGNYITVSSKPGKGQKADKSGYMLGVALADSNSESGKIPVAVDIKYVDLYTTISPAANRFLKSLDNILLASVQNPDQFTKLIKYLAAAIIVLGAFLISFLTFSKSMSNSVEAIGRNPLAKNSIYISLLINTVVVVTTLIIGLISAFILVKL